MGSLGPPFVVTYLLSIAQSEGPCMIPIACLYSPSCREPSFSETEELLFALPSPLIYYPLNERKPRACASPTGLPGVGYSWSTASLGLAAAAGAASGR